MVAGVVALLFFAGCKHANKPSRLTPTEVHQITQELAAAATDTAPPGSIVKSRRMRGRSRGTAAEEIYIGVRGGPAEMQKVQRKLQSLAAERGLSIRSDSSGSTIRMNLRLNGLATHEIEIEQLVLTEQTHAVSGKPRLAILLDDFGSDRRAADTIFALHVPVTISVLPFHLYSREIARDAKQHGCEVMLHLPMQSMANESPESHELRPGLTPGQLRTMVETMLEDVPEADGVNNHQGSQATADSVLMGDLMRVLKDEGVFYVDSRTTAATVAFDAAKREGVRTAFRNVPFLDDLQSKESVSRQLALAINGAKKKGEAIAIGHPRPATMEALKEFLPEARKQGVQLVVVSELVH